MPTSAPASSKVLSFGFDGLTAPMPSPLRARQTIAVCEGRGIFSVTPSSAGS